ncbi:hypothetical protein V8C35DRAFT_313086 [Trichoderma chlorosporum]
MDEFPEPYEKREIPFSDPWKEDSPVAKSLDDVRRATKRNVKCLRFWEDIYAKLDGEYTDASHAMASITEVVRVWCKAMVELVNDESNSDWKGMMLEAAPSTIVLSIRVSEDEKILPWISWSAPIKGFILTIPKAKMRDDDEAHLFLFKALLLSSFEKRAPKPLPVVFRGEGTDSEIYWILATSFFFSTSLVLLFWRFLDHLTSESRADTYMHLL